MQRVNSPDGDLQYTHFICAPAFANFNPFSLLKKHGLQSTDLLFGTLFSTVVFDLHLEHEVSLLILEGANLRLAVIESLHD